MSEFARGPVVVLGPDDGESFWQPLPSVGYIVNKLTPYNSPYDNFAMGLQVLGTFWVGQRSFMVGAMLVAEGSELDGLQMMEMSTQTRVIAIIRPEGPVRLRPRRDARARSISFLQIIDTTTNITAPECVYFDLTPQGTQSCLSESCEDDPSRDLL